MTTPSHTPTSRSFAAATIGWAALSGIGLVVGGQEGGLIVGVASQILVLYGLWRLQSQRRSSNGSSQAEATVLDDDVEQEL